VDDIGSPGWSIVFDAGGAQKSVSDLDMFPAGESERIGDRQAMNDRLTPGSIIKSARGNGCRPMTSIQRKMDPLTRANSSGFSSPWQPWLTRFRLRAVNYNVGFSGTPVTKSIRHGRAKRRQGR